MINIIVNIVKHLGEYRVSRALIGLEFCYISRSEYI
jgi:hypothetical protein